MLTPLFLNESDLCPESCGGKLVWPTVDNCSCHINPPCIPCVNNRLTCDVCGFVDDSPESVDIPVVLGDPGISMREYRPKPLSTTEIDYRVTMHTHFSQICEGVYPPGKTINDVLAKVKGTFGGRFEAFSDGKFRYIAYTD